MHIKWAARGLVIAAALLPLCALAQGLPALTSTPAANGGQNYTLSLQTMLLLTGLTFLPAACCRWCSACWWCWACWLARYGS